MLDHQFAAAVEQEEGARHASLHDVLTGMPNRALFNDRLERGFAQAKRHGWILALMFVDLDDFKKINDRYGHDIGDSVLQTIDVGSRTIRAAKIQSAATAAMNSCTWQWTSKRKQIFH